MSGVVLLETAAAAATASLDAAAPSLLLPLPLRFLASTASVADVAAPGSCAVQSEQIKKKEHQRRRRSFRAGGTPPPPREPPNKALLTKHGACFALLTKDNQEPVKTTRGEATDTERHPKHVGQQHRKRKTETRETDADADANNVSPSTLFFFSVPRRLAMGRKPKKDRARRETPAERRWKQEQDQTPPPWTCSGPLIGSP